MQVKNVTDSAAAPPAVARAVAGQNAPTASGGLPASPPSHDELKSAVASANRYLASANQRLEMAWDGESHVVVVKLVDAGTKEVIRQIPSEDALALARRLARFGEHFDAHA